MSTEKTIRETFPVKSRTIELSTEHVPWLTRLCLVYNIKNGGWYIFASNYLKRICIFKDFSIETQKSIQMNKLIPDSQYFDNHNERDMRVIVETMGVQGLNDAFDNIVRYGTTEEFEEFINSLYESSSTYNLLYKDVVISDNKDLYQITQDTVPVKLSWESDLGVAKLRTEGTKVVGDIYIPKANKPYPMIDLISDMFPLMVTNKQESGDEWEEIIGILLTNDFDESAPPEDFVKLLSNYEHKTTKY